MKDGDRQITLRKGVILNINPEIEDLSQALDSDFGVFGGHNECGGWFVHDPLNKEGLTDDKWHLKCSACGITAVITANVRTFKDLIEKYGNKERKSA